MLSSTLSGIAAPSTAITGVAVCGLAPAAKMRMSAVSGPTVRSTICFGWNPGIVGVAAIGDPAKPA